MFGSKIHHFPFKKSGLMRDNVGT